MYGILIEGKDAAGETKPERIPSEILPVFKYLKEPENYMPILVNMMLDMIGCYQFPELRHSSAHCVVHYSKEGVIALSFSRHNASSAQLPKNFT